MLFLDCTRRRSPVPRLSISSAINGRRQLSYTCSLLSLRPFPSRRCRGTDGMEKPRKPKESSSNPGNSLLVAGRAFRQLAAELNRHSFDSQQQACLVNAVIVRRLLIFGLRHTTHQ